MHACRGDSCCLLNSLGVSSAISLLSVCSRSYREAPPAAPAAAAAAADAAAEETAVVSSILLMSPQLYLSEALSFAAYTLSQVGGSGRAAETPQTDEAVVCIFDIFKYIFFVFLCLFQGL